MVSQLAVNSYSYIMRPAADANHDGLVSKAEFMKMMMFLKVVLCQVRPPLSAFETMHD